MGRQSNLTITESISELKKLQHQQPNIKSEKRILCLLLLKSNKFRTQGLIAQHLGVDRQTLVNWLSLYRNSGIEGILLKQTRDKKSKIITKEIHEGLSKKVNDSHHPLLGYWDAQKWVEEKYGVKISYHWLRKYLIKHFKTKLKVPRKSHHKKDEQAVNAFLKPS